MSLEDLENAGVLLPKDQWRKQPPRSAVSKPWFISVGLAALVAVGLMYWGDGRILTWLGAGVFLACLFTFTAICIRAADRQQRRTRGSQDASSE